MAFDEHRRARHLVEEARIAGIPGEDAAWLRGHVADCAACAAYEEALGRTVRAIQSFAFETDRSAAARIENRVANRVRKPAARRWASAAAVLLAMAAVPWYIAVRQDQRRRADAVLMEAVETRLERSVPEALEPLLAAPPEKSQ